MRTLQDITELLNELEYRIADELEDQDLDFKQWDTKSMDKSVKMLVRTAVCMANGGGGTVVFGVADKSLGRATALQGVPLEVDVNLLKKAVYNQTDPKIMPVYEEMRIPEGTGRLLIMQIYPGLPPYTDTSGTGSIRIGKDCQPLTGTLRRRIGIERGESDFTAEIIPATLSEIISPTAIENLRVLAKAESAPDDLLRMDDQQLLQALGVLSGGNVTKAALLLCGKEESLRQYIPSHHWIFLHMRSDIEYDIREDRVSAVPFSISRFEELLLPFNPITTIERGLYHFEYRTYPGIAFREALMNAFCHADYRIAGPVMVKLYDNHLEISNNGGFIAGITEQNILHHQPAARNPLLVEALTRLRLVNRSNLGIARMFSAFLIEGKRPPIIQEIGESITVTFLHSDLHADFRRFVSEIDGPPLSIDELLALSFLRQHPLSDIDQIAEYCKCTSARALDLLEALSLRTLVESSDKARHSLWQFATPVRQKYLFIQGEIDNRNFVLQLLRLNPESGLPISLIMEKCGMPRSSVKRLLGQLKSEGLVQIIGKGAGSRWSGVNTQQR